MTAHGTSDRESQTDPRRHRQTGLPETVANPRRTRLDAELDTEEERSPHRPDAA